jgi:hypothetical protein
MKRQLWFALILGAPVLLTACGGGSDNQTPTSPTIKTAIAVLNSATPPFSFDISYADSG